MAERIVLEQYDSLDVFSRCLGRPNNKVFNGKSTSHEKGDKDFYGTSSFEEAMDLFNNGWSEKAEEIRKDFVKFERAQERNVSYQKSRPTAAVVGFAPHVPNAILGLPNSMIYTERTPMKAKVVRLIHNQTMNAGTSEKTIMNAGLTVLKIAYSLERKGYRVRIDVNPMFTQSGSETACALVCVKDWRQPIDIKKVAFPIAHPSMFRRLGFRWLESTPDLKESGFRYGYGSAVNDAKRAKKILGDKMEDTDYFVDVNICARNDFDPAKTAEAIGIKNL